MNEAGLAAFLSGSAAAIARLFFQSAFYSLQLPGYALLWIIEECLLRNAFPFPALVSEFLHAGRRAVQPFEVEYPADDHHVAVDENRPDAFRHQRLRSRQYLAFVCRVGIAPDARHCLILLH